WLRDRRRRWQLHARQTHCKTTAARYARARGRDRAAVRFDEALDERQSDAKSAVHLRRGHVGLPEAVEDVRQEFRRDADAFVLDLDAHLRFVHRATHAHAPAAG